jgi:hypothetical protein
MATYFNPGIDVSGNGNNWTVNNINWTSPGTTYDIMTDVPTLTSATTANYCVLNPIARGTVTNGTITGGNLNLSTTTSDTRTYGTFGFPSSGKYYYELTNNNSGDKGQGIASVDSNGDTYQVLYFNTGDKRVDGTTSAYGASYTTGDVIGVAVDIDNNQITFYKNNSSQGAISYTFSSKPTMFTFVRREASTDASYSFNFGQRPFTYTPPTGFVALNTFNLPTPTIGATASTQANRYFDAILYTGNNQTPQTITGLNFQPDFLWIKGRTYADFHTVYDVIRTSGNILFPNGTNAEGVQSPPTAVTSFNSNGFSLGTDAGQFVNFGTNTYVAWAWDAGGTGVTNTAGSITSTVSANTSSGFSVVTYTGNGAVGATVGHGLGVAPSMIIVKRRTGATASWLVWHRSLSNLNNNYLLLDSTSGQLSSTNIWGTQTSSVIALDTDSLVNEQNANGSTFVAYCFAAVAGYSSFGSYTGNSSSDGPFVYTGFRPKYVMVKRSSNTGPWEILDASRNPYNAAQDGLRANASDAEISGIGPFDFVSNGFKLRGTGGGTNDSGTYIYAAFAESPFKYANAR